MQALAKLGVKGLYDVLKEECSDDKDIKIILDGDTLSIKQQESEDTSS